LNLPVALAVVAGLDLSERVAGGHRHDLDQVRDPGLLLLVVANLRARVGHRGLELLPHDVGLVDQPDDSLGRAACSRHEALRFLEVLDPRPGLGIDGARHDERLAEALVEPLGDVAGQLEVLALVVADRDDVGLVEQDVAGHQDGIVEEPGGDEVLLFGPLLELRHPPQLAECGHRAEQPGRFSVRLDVALREDG